MIGVSSYPTYQVFLAVLFAMVATTVLLPFWIKALKHSQIGQQVRADGPQRHLVKQGTPTMGGVIMLLAILITVILLGKPTPALIIVMVVTYLTGLLGFIDDISKVVHERSLGLTPHVKLISQGLISVLFCVFAVNWVGVSPIVTIPFINLGLDLGVLTTTFMMFGTSISVPWLYVVLVFFLLAGMSNAVNLTDGLDGLAAGCVMVVMAIMAAIAFRNDHIDIAIFSAACAGSCIGFLWFNCYPADIFMGDTGSLALGAALASVAVVTGTELFSLIIGGLFVVEACSVLLQVIYFKLTGKRVFLMAPIHHHFEKKGWSETKVVIRFWIVSGAFAFIGFALYFLGTLS